MFVQSFCSVVETLIIRSLSILKYKMKYFYYNIYLHITNLIEGSIYLVVTVKYMNCFAEYGQCIIEIKPGEYLAIDISQ